MIGVYKIPLPPDVSPSDHPSVKRLLASLDKAAQHTVNVIEAPLIIRDGTRTAAAKVSTGYGCESYYQADATRYCVIKAHGGKAKSKAPLKSKATPPAPLTAEQCRKRLAEAEETLRYATPDHAMFKRNYTPREYFQHEIAAIPAEEFAEKKAEIEEMDARFNDALSGIPYDPYGDYVRHRKHQKAIGKALARIVSQAATRIDNRNFRPSTEHYAWLDQAAGRRVKRVSELNTREKESGGWFIAALSLYADGRIRDNQRRTPKPSAPVWSWSEKAAQKAAADRQILGTQYGSGQPWQPPVEPEPQNVPWQGYLEAKADTEHWREMARLAKEREGRAMSKRILEVTA